MENLPEIEAEPTPKTISFYQIEVPIRGYSFTLKQIKEVCDEFQHVVAREGERVLATLQKPDDKSADEFEAEKARYRAGAFLVTISVIGGRRQHN